MNLLCVIPKADFNEEKQMLLVAYCALVGKPFPTHLVDCLGMNYPNFFVVFIAMTWHELVWQCGNTVLFHFLFLWHCFQHEINITVYSHTPTYLQHTLISERTKSLSRFDFLLHVFASSQMFSHSSELASNS